jgi:hypothetical protein
MQPFKRKIFYLGGYDPRGSRYYHDLLAQQVAAHNAAGAAPEGLLHLSARRRIGRNMGWDINTPQLYAQTEFLVWDDLVRGDWSRSPIRLAGQAIGAYRHMLRGLDWDLAARTPRGSRIAVFFPGVAYLLLPVLLPLILCGLLALALPWWAALVGGLALGWGITFAALRWISALWLLRFVVFNDALAREMVSPAYQERLGQAAARIQQAFTEEWDEVLLVTHSNGSILAVPLMARLLELCGGAIPPHFALVTLGNCMQLLACRKDAAWFGQLLDRLGQGHFRWLDIGSPTDGACAPLVPPCLGRAVESPAGLTQISPRWFCYCDAATYQARRRDKYTTHFDYLRRLDRPSALDFLGLTASARPLNASIAAFEAEQHG